MERLLAGDTQRQQRLSKVIKFIRDEFAFDGFMENGIEEQAMGKFVILYFFILYLNNTKKNFKANVGTN